MRSPLTSRNSVHSLRNVMPIIGILPSILIPNRGLATVNLNTKTASEKTHPSSYSFFQTLKRKPGSKISAKTHFGDLYEHASADYLNNFHGIFHQVKKVGRTNDKGIDLTGYMKYPKGHIPIYAQCKCTKKTVGFGVLSSFCGVLDDENVLGIFISTKGLSKSAYESFKNKNRPIINMILPKPVNENKNDIESLDISDYRFGTDCILEANYKAEEFLNKKGLYVRTYRSSDGEYFSMIQMIPDKVKRARSETLHG